MTKHRRNSIIAAIAAVAAVAAIIFYALFDPADSEVLAPRCVFKALTGYDCPGCGFQRALHALLHGHFAEAWHFNAALFVMIPLACTYLMIEICPARFQCLQRILMSTKMLVAVLIAVIAWWILRNIFSI